MARATAAQTSDRIDALQGMILEGEPNTACLTFARQQWGISRAQGYKLMKRAWTQIKDDVDETGIDRLELLAWSIQTLMTGEAIRWEDFIKTKIFIKNDEITVFRSID